MKNLLLCLILIGLLLNINAFAEEGREIKAEDQWPFLKPLTCIETFAQPVKQNFKKNNIDLNFSAGLLQGFDSNVNLDSDKKEDAFLDTALNTEATYNYTDDVRAKIGNDTTYILYYTWHDATFLDIYNTAGLELDLLDDMFTCGIDYVLDYTIFPSDEEGTYLSNEGEISVRHNVASNIYHKAGYKFLYKRFSHYKTRDSSGARTSDLREDIRSGANYEIGLLLFDRAVLKTNLEFYYNDSNYDYHHYYDYWSFRVRPSCVFMLTEKLYATGSFAYYLKKYDDRLSSEDNARVYDDTYNIGLSLLYDLTKSLTVAINYSYRENVSNEPLQEYTGNMITGGLYYFF